jgi:hypothetical protein
VVRKAISRNGKDGHYYSTVEVVVVEDPVAVVDPVLAPRTV